MNYTESWNYLCTQHRNGLNKSEAELQRDWENYFIELFGYSRIKNDIVPHPQLVLGSTEREIPDILLCRTGKKLFVAELKQYSIVKIEKIEKQILNYLTHTDIHLSVGILVCEKLYIYCYDFTTNAKIELEIPFEENNANGIKFMELFSKQNFDEKEIQDFVFENHLSAQNVSEIRSAISVDLIKDLLKKYFLQKYSKEDFEKAIGEFEISVNRKKPVFLENKSGSKNSCIVPKKDTTLSKQQIAQLCEENGVYIDTSNLTLAGRNGNHYPANVNFKLLGKDWYIALDDRELRKLHVFKVPANSLKPEQMVIRKDKKDYFLFYIKWNSPSFLENKSGIKFKQWLVKNISY